jgi:hypothetical protein
VAELVVPRAMQRWEAETLVRKIFRVTGFRAERRRLPDGAPADAVWVVEAVHVLTRTRARLHSPAEWARFLARARNEEVGLAVQPAARDAAEEEPMPSENGTAIVVETPAVPAEGPSVPMDVGVPASGAATSVDFGSWEAMTRAAADRAQAEATALEQRLVSLHSEMLRMRQELREALAARRREVVLLRRALALSVGTPGPDPTTGPLRGSKSETARAKAQREATHGQLLEWAESHGGELVLRDFRETSTLYASSVYRALTGVKGLVTSGVMEKVEPGRYRLVARREAPV